MKVWGWILVVFGGLSAVGAFVVAVEGGESNFGGITFVVLGLYLLHLSKQKQKQQKDQKKWDNES